MHMLDMLENQVRSIAMPREAVAVNVPPLIRSTGWEAKSFSQYYPVPRHRKRQTWWVAGSKPRHRIDGSARPAVHTFQKRLVANRLTTDQALQITGHLLKLAV